MSSCPLEYALNFPREPKFESRCLYVVGGLYGNIFALEQILAMADAENASVVFNGDIHWFDAEAKSFCKIEREIAKRGLTAVNGNVEFELVSGQNGCGCFYPPCTDAGAVGRSNLIHARLSHLVKKECAQNLEIFKNRHKCELISVGGANVAITHGDEKFLAGWGCSRESLSEPVRQKELDAWLAENKFDVLACTHTCASAAIALQHGIVINNGAAGMPNFAPLNLEFAEVREILKFTEKTSSEENDISQNAQADEILKFKGEGFHARNLSGTLFGLISRIAMRPNKEAIYRAKRGRIYVEALPVRYDGVKFLKWFDEIWGAQSPAAISYRSRIVSGTTDKISDAMLGGFTQI